MSEALLTDNNLRVDPFATFSFSVSIDGLTLAGFTEISAISAETQVEKIKVGGMNQSEISLLGPTKYSDVVMKKGMCVSSELALWHECVIKGIAKRSNIHIVSKDFSGNIRAMWILIDAVPIKLITPALKAMSTELAIMEVTFTHNGILRVL